VSRWVILTARDGVTDTVAALSGGADHCIAKPFAFCRAAGPGAAAAHADRVPEATVLQVGDQSLDLRTPGRVWPSGRWN
jgi:DNA-binding response OmpR family regulator